jgi:bud emergence protein 1
MEYQMNNGADYIVKQVIKALFNWTPDNPAPNSGYMSFNEGDFLHVVGREDDDDWYEACNPLQNKRGLVPVKYFQVVNKQMRDSGGSALSGARQSGSGHDSGYGESPNGPPGMNGMMSGGLGGIPTSGGSAIRMSKMAGFRGQGATVYGVVQYDFKAERPDELDAKEGEFIIVIAQSNPEWFVAKPITRLGGPGLIPVSFIEIRDMTTGKAVPDALEAVQRAGVPKVEEWKKMAADYKNGSIPLGKLDGNVQNMGLESSMARMSLQSGQQGYPQQNPYAQVCHFCCSCIHPIGSGGSRN